MWGKLVRRGGTRQLVGAACASMSVCSLWMLGWCCVLRAWVCLLLERQRCWDGRGLTYVCAGTARERAPGGGSRGCVLERSWYGAWVTHPDRQQSSGVSRSCWEMSQPLETPQPKLCRPASPLTICCWNTTGAFFFFLIVTVCCWGKLTISSVCVPVTVTEDDSSERNHYISLCRSSCW